MIQDNGVVKPDRGLNRKAIRDQVVKILKNKTAVGPRVFPNSTVPTWEKELPVILIFPTSEPASKFSAAPRELERTLTLAVEIVASGPEVDEEGNPPPAGVKSLEDILDEIAEQVECEMSRDTSLADTADDSVLVNSEFEFEGIGGVPIGSARLSFEISYLTHYPRSIDKQGGGTDFKTSKVEYHTGRVDDDSREAEDTVVIPQT